MVSREPARWDTTGEADYRWRIQSLRCQERIDQTCQRQSGYRSDCVHPRSGLQAGERVRWAASDKARGIFNSDGARVVCISPAGIEVELANKGRLHLPPGDKMLQHLGLGYTINMHQAQGMTQDHAIGAVHSSEKHLSNAGLFHVMATRAREGFELFTDNVKALTRTIGHNAGDKASVLEIVGEKDLKASLNGPSGCLSEASFRAEPEKHSGPQLQIPEKSIELGP